MREAFSANKCLVLPGLFDAEFVDCIVSRVDPRDFYQKVHVDRQLNEFSSDVTLRESEPALHLLHFVMNNPALFPIIERITGCQKVAGFGGRIYCIVPEDGHHLEWHDDTEAGDRLVGISVNLGAGIFEGGMFQLREKMSHHLLAEVGNESPGDAHIFDIDPKLEHRVTEIKGDAPRVAAAGWFLSKSAFFDRIRMTAPKRA